MLSPLHSLCCGIDSDRPPSLADFWVLLSCAVQGHGSWCSPVIPNGVSIAPDLWFLFPENRLCPVPRSLAGRSSHSRVEGDSFWLGQAKLSPAHPVSASADTPRSFFLRSELTMLWARSHRDVFEGCCTQINMLCLHICLCRHALCLPEWAGKAICHQAGRAELTVTWRKIYKLSCIQLLVQGTEWDRFSEWDSDGGWEQVVETFLLPFVLRLVPTCLVKSSPAFQIQSTWVTRWAHPLPPHCNTDDRNHPTGVLESMMSFVLLHKSFPRLQVSCYRAIAWVVFLQPAPKRRVSGLPAAILCVLEWCSCLRYRRQDSVCDRYGKRLSHRPVFLTYPV